MARARASDSAKWEPIALAEPCLWIEPLEIDFGRVHRGGRNPARQLVVQNLGEREVDVALSAEGQSCLKIVPVRKDALRPGHIAVFEVGLDVSRLAVDEETSRWQSTIAVDAVLSEAPRGQHEARRHEVKARCKLVKLPRLLIRDDAGREIGDDGLELTVTPSPEPLMARWQVSRSDGAPLALESNCISYQLRRISTGDEPTDYTSCLEVEVQPDAADRTISQVIVTLHTHNLPEGRLEGRIGFWVGEEEPPVEPRGVKLAILVTPRRVVVQWPECAREALQGQRALTIPGPIGSWLPVKIVNPTQHHLEVEFEALTSWLSFEPTQVELPPGGESQVRAEFRPESTSKQDSTLLSYVAHMRRLTDQAPEKEPIALWGEALFVETMSDGWLSCELEFGQAFGSQLEATVLLRNQTDVNISLRPANFTIKDRNKRDIELQGASNDEQTSQEWRALVTWDGEKAEESQLSVVDPLTGRRFTVWAGRVQELPKPQLPTRAVLLSCSILLALCAAGFWMLSHFTITRRGPNERATPQQVSAAMLRDAVSYVEKAVQVADARTRQELLGKALALLDGVLEMAPDNEVAHYHKARALSLTISYRPHPYESELRRELDWLARHATAKEVRAEAEARAKEWGFR